MPEGFVYDTEPPSRAVLAMGSIDTEKVFPMLKGIQSAFYAEGRDVTKADTLADIAAAMGVERIQFTQVFESDEIRARTLAHFKHARQAKVSGFPTLVLQQGDDLHLITNGWQPLDEIRRALDSRA